MIEHGMVFALGFFTAGLLALACLPAVWNRALRLTSHRLRQLVPLSDEEIAAEHAGLKAQFAVAQRRLEQRFEGSETKRSTLLADLGRQGNEIEAMKAAAVGAAATHAELRGELDAARRELVDLRAQAGAADVALYDLEGLAERRFHDLGALRRELQVREERIDADRAAIAAFETRVLGLETRLADQDQLVERVKADLVRSVAGERQAGLERDGARQAAEVLAAKRDGLDASLGRMTGELARQTDKAADAERRLVQQVQVAASQAETIADLKAQLGDAQEASRASAARMEELRAEAAARRSVARDEDLDVLRDTLKQVADDVLRLTSRHAEPASPPG